MSENFLEEVDIKSSPSPCSNPPSPGAIEISPKMEVKGFSVENLLDQKKTTLKEEVKPNQMELFGEFMKKFQPNMKMEMNMMPQFMLWNNLLRSAIAQNGAPLSDPLKLGHNNVLPFLHSDAGSSFNLNDSGKLSRESSNPSPVHSDQSSDHAEGDLSLRDGGIRKKKTRTVFNRTQVSQLEHMFNAHKYLNGGQRSSLAKELGLTEVQVKIWFQNRRNKFKRTQNGEEPTNMRPRNMTPGLMNNFPSMVHNGAGGTPEDAMRMLLQQTPLAQAHLFAQSNPLLGAMTPLFGQLNRPESEAEATFPNMELYSLFLQCQKNLNQTVAKNSGPSSNPSSSSSEAATLKPEWSE